MYRIESSLKASPSVKDSFSEVDKGVSTNLQNFIFTRVTESLAYWERKYHHEPSSHLYPRMSAMLPNLSMQRINRDHEKLNHRLEHRSLMLITYIKHKDQYSPFIVEETLIYYRWVMLVAYIKRLRCLQKAYNYMKKRVTAVINTYSCLKSNRMRFYMWLTIRCKKIFVMALHIANDCMNKIRCERMPHRTRFI
jgi:hypothetical protein